MTALPEQMTLLAREVAAGAVYTPSDLARFVLDRARAADGSLPAGRWLDPACGEGAFLGLLVEELASCVPTDQLAAVVTQRVFGIDIDEQACAVARRAVQDAVTAAAGPQPDDFFHENVITADTLASGDELGLFGLVIGNPPYIGATQLSREEKTRFLERFATAWGRLDLYGLFIERGLQLLAPGGRLTFITPDKLLIAISCRPLRAHIAREFAVESIARFDRHDLFPGVATVPCVTSISRTPPRPVAECRWWDRAVDGFSAVGSAAEVPLGDDGEAWHYEPKSAGRPALLGDIAARISVGVATGLNRCFVMSAAEARHAGLEPDLLRSAVRGRDIESGALRDPELRLLLPYEFDADGSAGLVDLERFPSALRYLEQFKDVLADRHCVRVWDKRWYDLHDPVTSDLAKSPKVVLPDIARVPRFAPDDGRVVPLHSAYYIVPAEDSGWDAWSLAAALNHPEVADSLCRVAPTAKSGFRRFRAEVLRKVRLPMEPLRVSRDAA